MRVCEQHPPRRADSGELVADARLAVAAEYGPAVGPPGLLCSGPYLPPGSRGPPVIPLALPLALPLAPRADALGPPRWAGLIVPPAVPFSAFRAGGAPEAKAEEADEAEGKEGEEEEDPRPLLALRARPEPEPEPSPRRSSRKRKGPDHGPFLG